MNWDDLKIFLELARQGRLAVAAERLNLDQTTISRRIQRLESSLSTHLFDRTRAGHILTAEGQRLLAHAEQCETAVFDARESVLGGDKALSGAVRLNTTEAFGAFFIAKGLAGFSLEFPNIDLDLIASAGFLSLTKREIDLAIQLAKPRHGRIISQKLTDYRLKLYASQSYLDMNEPVKSVTDLKNHRLIGYVDDQIYAPELRYLQTITKSDPHIRSSSLIAQLNLTIEGGGLCILPQFLAQQESKLVPILQNEVELERTFWLLTHEDLQHTARIRVVRDFLFDYVSQNRDLLMS